MFTFDLFNQLRNEMSLSKITLLVLVLMISGYGFSQEKADSIPDGTQGEYLEVVNDTLPQKWKDKRWRLFPGKISTFKIGAGFLYDFVAFSPDKVSKQQMDSAGVSLDPTFKVRDFRILVSGQFKTKRNISWKAGLMYDGPTRSWFLRETGVMIEVPELSGHIFVGRTKEGFSLNKVMNGYAGWTMERQMAIDVIPILADGIKSLGYLPKPRILWNIGIFADWLSHTQSFSTFQWQFISRIGWLPIYSPEQNKVLHAGFSYRYGVPVDDQMRLRSRPESNPAPYFIDTGNFSADHSDQFGWEIYYSSGPWMFGTEYYFHKFSSPETGSPVFSGGEFVVSYMLTGESRPYSPSTGIYGFVPIKKSVFKGGTGAVEALIRISTLDLDDGQITGGKFSRITPMVNWYLSKEARFELAYGYGVLNRFKLEGKTHFFQARLSLTLL